LKQKSERYLLKRMATVYSIIIIQEKEKQKKRGDVWTNTRIASCLALNKNAFPTIIIYDIIFVAKEIF